ncbi:gamma subclass chorismate mutase AroQ [Streptomyces sp. NPDC059255]|uniref:gamma subclass chorismate mutase AroQ n=1 Tax=Streptomyces sp. NPDC059255 TaxID=3346793 RepID=UPI00367AD74D
MHTTAAHTTPTRTTPTRTTPARTTPTTPSVRRRVALTAATALLLLAPGTASAAVLPAPEAPAVRVFGASDRPTGAFGRLYLLAELSARRLATADLVAAAKRGTGSPVDAPERERQVLSTAAHRAQELGADPAVTVRIFRDQIEANKDVQRELLRRWDADPEHAPSERPDLAGVRAEIDRIDAGLVRAVAGSAQDRTAPRCGRLLTAAAVRAAAGQRQDLAHAKALGRALGSVCARDEPPVRKADAAMP